MIGILDQEFAHHGFSSLIEPKLVKWDWHNANNPIVFLTDRELFRAKNINGSRKIAWLVEPLVYHPDAYAFVTNNLDLFDYVITHNDDILKLSDKCLFCNASATTWIQNEDCKIHNKSKLVSVISSGKTVTPGHLLRNAAVEKFGQRMDCFGPSNLPRLSGKVEALRDYYFTVVILNCKCDSYFSEALVDACMTGTIPVFWGTDKISDFFSEKGMITFNTLDDLDKILDAITPDLYMSKIEEVKKNFTLAAQYKAPEDWLYENYPAIFH